MQASGNAGGSNTIQLPAGEYHLELVGSGEDEPEAGDLDIQGGAITITGAGAAGTIVNAGGLGRAFRVHEGASLTLKHTSVLDGETSPTTGQGGAFLNEGALTIEHGVLESNSAARGGAVYMTLAAGKTSILYSTVEHNGGGEGGVVYSEGGEVTLAGDTIDHNNVVFTGGVLADVELNPGPVTVSRSTISNNESGGAGGGSISKPPEKTADSAN